MMNYTNLRLKEGDDIFYATCSVLLFPRPPSNEHDGAITGRAKLVGWRTAEPVTYRTAGSPSDES